MPLAMRRADLSLFGGVKATLDISKFRLSCRSVASIY